MNQFRMFQYLTFVVLGFCAIVLHATPAASQSYGMSISSYQDADVDADGIMFAWTTVSDNSWECSHSGYYTVANIVSPSNRTSSSGGSGLNSSTTISVIDDYEAYSVYPMITFSCSCMYGNQVTMGGSAQIYDVKPFTSRLVFRSQR